MKQVWTCFIFWWGSHTLPYSLNSAKTDAKQFLSHGFPHFSDFIFLAGATCGNFCAERTLIVWYFSDIHGIRYNGASWTVIDFTCPVRWVSSKACLSSLAISVPVIFSAYTVRPSPLSALYFLRYAIRLPNSPSPFHFPQIISLPSASSTRINSYEDHFASQNSALSTLNSQNAKLHARRRQPCP